MSKRNITPELNSKVNTIWKILYGKVPKGTGSKAAIEREIADEIDTERIARKILGKRAQLSEITTFMLILFMLGITVGAAWVIGDQITTAIQHSTINDSVPQEVIGGINTVAKAGDMIMLAVVAGMLLLLILTGVLLPTSPIFTVFYLLGSILVWMLSIPLANGWEQFASQGAMAQAAAALPYTNALLSNLPIFTGGLVVLVLLILYAKRFNMEA